MVVKPRSSNYGNKVTVIDPNWNHMVKVHWEEEGSHQGEVISYDRKHLVHDESDFEN